MSSPYSGATPAGDQGHARSGRRRTTRQLPAPPRPIAVDTAAARDPTTAEGHPDVEGTSVGQLIGEVTKDLSTLMRQELELAKAEVTVEAKKAGQGAGMFGAAGFAGYMVLMFLSFALWWALENVMDAGLGRTDRRRHLGRHRRRRLRHGPQEVPAGPPEARAHHRHPPAGARRPQAQLTPSAYLPTGDQT